MSVTITVNPARTVGINNLRLGTQFDHEKWQHLVNRAVIRDLIRAANIKLVRVFNFRPTEPKLEPCIYWDEAAKTGTWNWSRMDTFIDAIFACGAEPQICIFGPTGGILQLPDGMAVNETTSIPYPESATAYCREYMRHFRQTGRPVRYYQIFNEISQTYGWSPTQTQMGWFRDVFNACAAAMRSEDASIKLSFDFITRKTVLDYWLAYGGTELDYLDYHKYDGGAVGQYTDAEMFSRAESRYFTSTPLGYSVTESQSLYEKVRGRFLPLIDSEVNFSAAWREGTDPRNTKHAGAVWSALTLRKEILARVQYHIHFEFMSSKKYGESRPSGGWGFGLVNSDDNMPYVPYYVYSMIGSSLSQGDHLVEATSGSGSVRALAWRHGTRCNVLVVNTTHDVVNVEFRGLTGRRSYMMVDESVPAEAPTLLVGVLDSSPLRLNGYAVALVGSEYYLARHVLYVDSDPSNVGFEVERA